MHFSTTLAVAAAVSAMVSAHGSALPKIVGLSPKDLKGRNLLSNLGARFVDINELAKRPTNKLKSRDDLECGPGVGSCGAGLCCSLAGYCGSDDDYCYAPGCQYEYGPGCPDNAIPAGTNTSSVGRDQLGSVAYGGDGIYSCATPGTVAITYDDGPQKVLTSHILDLLASYNAKATFFITGNNINKGQIDKTEEFIEVIKRMDSEGHQIASHTWTHLDLSAISQDDRKNQMYKNEMALRNIVGKIPTYMRPPYSSCTGQCETDLADLGYHVIYFDVDTDDYEHDDPSLIQTSKDWFTGNITKGSVSSSSWLEIGHDIHEQTANNLTEYMLSTLTQLGYKAVTVGECLGDAEANWYRSASGAGTYTLISSSATSSAPVPTGTIATTDATCGGANAYTCLGSSFGNCCSASGWCGSSSDYCGTGCQPSFGNCGDNSAVSSSSMSTTSLVRTSSPSPALASASTVRASSTISSVAPSASASGKVTSDATCGGINGYTCLGSSFGNCCSSAGWCGSSTDYCGAGCQSSFGNCSSNGASSSEFLSSSVKASSSTVAASFTVKPSSVTVSSVRTSSGTPSTASIVSSLSARPSPTQDVTASSIVRSSSVATVVTAGASSSSVRASSTPAISPIIHASSTAASPIPSASTGLRVSTDGTCGGTTGFTCQDSSFGNCCSQYGWCGSSTDHCSTGCNSTFGTCVRGESTSTKGAAPSKPTHNVKISRDGTCGGNTGYTCLGSRYGNCCSQYGWCGRNRRHCGSGCNSVFGSCN